MVLVFLVSIELYGCMTFLKSTYTPKELSNKCYTAFDTLEGIDKFTTMQKDSIKNIFREIMSGHVPLFTNTSIKILERSSDHIVWECA